MPDMLHRSMATGSGPFDNVEWRAASIGCTTVTAKRSYAVYSQKKRRD